MLHHEHASLATSHAARACSCSEPVCMDEHGLPPTQLANGAAVVGVHVVEAHVWVPPLCTLGLERGQVNAHHISRHLGNQAGGDALRSSALQHHIILCQVHWDGVAVVLYVLSHHRGHAAQVMPVALAQAHLVVAKRVC